MTTGEKVVVTIDGNPQVAKFIRRENGFPACKVQIGTLDWTVKPEEVQTAQEFLTQNKLVIDLTRLKQNTRRNVAEVTGKSIKQVQDIVNAAKGVGLLT